LDGCWEKNNRRDDTGHLGHAKVGKSQRLFIQGQQKFLAVVDGDTAIF
jgi:hypothetical protein